MADKTKKDEPKEAPKVEETVKKVTGFFSRWAHRLEDLVEGVGVLGGIFYTISALLGIKYVRGGKASGGTADATSERSGPASLLDEFFFMKALFGRVPDREILPADIRQFLHMLDAAGLSYFQRRKLYHLIGYEVDKIVIDLGNNQKLIQEINLMGRQIIIGLNELGEPLAIDLLTKTPILDNPIDTLCEWYKYAKSHDWSTQTAAVERWANGFKASIIAANLPAKTKSWFGIGVANIVKALLWWLGGADIASAERAVVARERKVAAIWNQSSYERNLKPGPKLGKMWAVMGIIIALCTIYLIAKA